MCLSQLPNSPQIPVFFNTAALLWSTLYKETRGIFYQASRHCADLSETRAGHTLLRKYITHTLMGSKCSQAFRHSSVLVNGWALQHISFWKISPI